MRVQPAVVVTLAIILVTTLISGPAVSAIDLTSSGTLEGSDLGDGRVTVSEITLPDGVAFERGDFGSGSYYLRVPAATVELQEVVGRPILSYEVSVEELGFTRSSVHVLSASNEGSYQVTIDEAAFGDREIQKDSYSGTLSITARYGETETVLVDRNVSIQVIG